jgi:hypothetical protein
MCAKKLQAALLLFSFLGANIPAAEQGFLREPFPALYFTAAYQRWISLEAARPYWVPTELESNSLAGGSKPIFLNNDIIAYYGHPQSPNMGILGRYDPDELTDRLNELARQYNEANGERGIRTAFYIIYGTVQPGGRISYIPEEILQKYLRFALNRNMLVFIDHQIGRNDPVESLKEMLPYLHYPNVHLALDPEWRTDKPMERIGRVSAAELNTAQEEMSRYIQSRNLPGERMLVVHQFNYRMIEEREKVQTGYRNVVLVHCADGFGTPPVKKGSYRYNALAGNMPIKGFKLFYNFNIPGAGYDDPLLLPEEVLALKPRPYLIMYQ